MALPAEVLPAELAPSARQRAAVANPLSGRHMVSRLLVGFLLLMPVAAQAELYKYTNEDGVTVLDSHVPARYVKNGYTILSLDGRVLEVVERALTDAEIRDRDQRRAEAAERDRIAHEQKIADDNLLRLYGAPEDVTRARDTKLASIDGFINTSRSNLARVKAQPRAIRGGYGTGGWHGDPPASRAHSQRREPHPSVRSRDSAEAGRGRTAAPAVCEGSAACSRTADALS